MKHLYVLQNSIVGVLRHHLRCGDGPLRDHGEQPDRLESHCAATSREAGRTVRDGGRRTGAVRDRARRRRRRRAGPTTRLLDGGRGAVLGESGRDAIGTDISDVAIEAARRKAAEAGIAAEFRQADMFALPPDLIDLDLDLFQLGCDLLGAGPRSVRRHRRRPAPTRAERLCCPSIIQLWEVLGVRGDNDTEGQRQLLRAYDAGRRQRRRQTAGRSPWVRRTRHR